MNLVICLLVARTYVRKAKIREAVEGYRDQADEAFEKMFERDKDELKMIGVPIELGYIDKAFGDEPGYRIRRGQFELPEISLAADEAAVVGLAARVWQHARLAGATTAGLRKLRLAGVSVDESQLAIIEPQLATNEPAFDDVYSAVTTRQPISFHYRAPGAIETAVRKLEPWGIVSWHGHWYVVGHDRDREATRMFRVSRIEAPVKTLAKAGSYSVPDGVNVRDLAASLAPPHPHLVATVQVRTGAGDALRRRASKSLAIDEEWTRLEVPYASGSALADELTALGPVVVAVEPSEVREAVVRRLRALTQGEKQ